MQESNFFKSDSDSGSPIELFFTLHFEVKNPNTGLLKRYNFFETFIETKNPCCVPRIPLIDSFYKIVDSQTSFTLWTQQYQIGVERIPSGVSYYCSCKKGQQRPSRFTSCQYLSDIATGACKLVPAVCTFPLWRKVCGFGWTSPRFKVCDVYSHVIQPYNCVR